MMPSVSSSASGCAGGRRRTRAFTTDLLQSDRGRRSQQEGAGSEEGGSGRGRLLTGLQGRTIWGWQASPRPALISKGVLEREAKVCQLEYRVAVASQPPPFHPPTSNQLSTYVVLELQTENQLANQRLTD